VLARALAIELRERLKPPRRSTGAAELAHQVAQSRTEDDQASDCQHGHQGNDQAVLNQTLSSLTQLDHDDSSPGK
jgi:hypothetical protein